jgi:hypothetical protein
MIMSLEKLKLILQPGNGNPAVSSWDSTEETLGTRLPTDYKEI